MAAHRLRWLRADMLRMKKIIRHLEVESTNDLARDPSLRHGDVVIARSQSAGRGQQGNCWLSEPGKNLTFSLVLEPMLPAGEQFFLSQAVSLALIDTLATLGLRPSIKWPNDIYVGEKKIAGLLIENDIQGALVTRSIVGVGLNVNQMEFPPEIPGATSVARESGMEIELEDVFERFYEALQRRYGMLESGLEERLQVDYRAVLWRLDTPGRYRTPDDPEPFEAMIRGVSPGGEITLELRPGGELRTYLFKQIEFL